MADAATAAVAAAFPHSVKLSLPFPSERHAQIVYDVLRVDREPNAKSRREMAVHGSSLDVEFKASELKFLRVAVGAFLDLLLLSTETLDQFGLAQ
eukprot:m.35256 g.35256  ORF g.35256 m.35256 type:complete len:95 (-) comp11261_c0_seq1:222-506(-)